MIFCPFVRLVRLRVKSYLSLLHVFIIVGLAISGNRYAFFGLLSKIGLYSMSVRLVIAVIGS